MLTLTQHVQITAEEMAGSFAEDTEEFFELLLCLREDWVENLNLNIKELVEGIDVFAPFQKRYMLEVLHFITEHIKNSD